MQTTKTIIHLYYIMLKFNRMTPWLQCFCLLIGFNSCLANTLPPTILILGDSISNANDINRSQGWVSLLQQRLSNNNYQHKIINASINGDTTENGATRLPILLEKHQPVIIIIAIGANDGLRGLSLTAMKHNLEQMISSSQKQGSSIILTSIRLPPNYGSTFNQRFSTTYYLLAEKYKIPLVKQLLNHVSDLRQMIQKDGIHPTVSAHAKILENIWPTLLPFLKP